MRRVDTRGIVMGDMDRVKVKDKARDMDEIATEDEIVKDHEMIDTINKTKVGMDTLNLLLKLRVVREMHHQDPEFH
jgi:hypothetical protein